MKIISTPGWTHKFTCSCCNAGLEGDAADARLADETASDELAYVYIQCPLCGTRHELVDCPPEVRAVATKLFRKLAKAYARSYR